MKCIDFYKSKYREIDVILFTVLLIIASGAMFVLFYRQATMFDESLWLYPSDIRPYIDEMLGTQTKYNFPYPILFKTAYVIYLVIGNPDLSMAITITLFNVIAMIITKVCLCKSTKTFFISTASTFCLFFLSMVYYRGFEKLGMIYRFMGVGSPNPWHNATYMAARPFMILAFVYGAKVLSTYEIDFEKGHKLNCNRMMPYIISSFSLLLATMAKPSYTLVHLIVCACVMLYRFIITKFKNFRQSVCLGLTFIPTLFAMLYQYGSVFTGTSSVGEEQGIGFGCFRVWSSLTGNVPIAIILAGLFPLVVLMFNYRSLVSDSLYRFSWLIYLAGFLTNALLYEKGFREKDGNFFWGYICGLFIVFFSSIYLISKDTRQELFIFSELNSKKFVLIFEWLLLILHTLMGLRYFQLLCYGGNYV